MAKVPASVVKQAKALGLDLDRCTIELVPQRNGCTWKAAWRDIGGQHAYFRSRWEANYARFLEWQKTHGQVAKWEHEPETFWFTGVKRGTVSYLPDFRVTLPDGAIEYHEVKGWMDPQSKTKLRRMKKYHPNIKMVLIDAKSYRALAKMFAKAIVGWES